MWESLDVEEQISLNIKNLCRLDFNLVDSYPFSQQGKWLCFHCRPAQENHKLSRVPAPPASRQASRHCHRDTSTCPHGGQVVPGHTSWGPVLHPHQAWPWQGSQMQQEPTGSLAAPSPRGGPEAMSSEHWGQGHGQVPAASCSSLSRGLNSSSHTAAFCSQTIQVNFSSNISWGSFQMLSWNPNILHLLISHHLLIFVIPSKMQSSLSGEVYSL